MSQHFNCGINSVMSSSYGLNSEPLSPRFAGPLPRMWTQSDDYYRPQHYTRPNNHSKDCCLSVDNRLGCRGSDPKADSDCGQQCSESTAESSDGQVFNTISKTKLISSTTQTLVDNEVIPEDNTREQDLKDLSEWVRHAFNPYLSDQLIAEAIKPMINELKAMQDMRERGVKDKGFKHNLIDFESNERRIPQLLPFLTALSPLIKALADRTPEAVNESTGYQQNDCYLDSNEGKEPKVHSLLYEITEELDINTRSVDNINKIVDKELNIEELFCENSCPTSALIQLEDTNTPSVGNPIESPIEPLLDIPFQMESKPIESTQPLMRFESKSNLSQKTKIVDKIGQKYSHLSEEVIFDSMNKTRDLLIGCGQKKGFSGLKISEIVSKVSEYIDGNAVTNALTKDLTKMCGICHKPIAEVMSKYTLSCGHTFHEHCLKLWAQTHNRCPNC